MVWSVVLNSGEEAEVDLCQESPQRCESRSEGGNGAASPKLSVENTLKKTNVNLYNEHRRAFRPKPDVSIIMKKRKRTRV